MIGGGDADRDGQHREALEFAASVRDLHVAALAIVGVVQIGRHLVESLDDALRDHGGMTGIDHHHEVVAADVTDERVAAGEIAGDLLDQAGSWIWITWSPRMNP